MNKFLIPVRVTITGADDPDKIMHWLCHRMQDSLRTASGTLEGEIGTVGISWDVYEYVPEKREAQSNDL